MEQEETIQYETQKVENDQTIKQSREVRTKISHNKRDQEQRDKQALQKAREKMIIEVAKIINQAENVGGREAESEEIQDLINNIPPDKGTNYPPHISLITKPEEILNSPLETHGGIPIKGPLTERQVSKLQKGKSLKRILKKSLW